MEKGQSSFLIFGVFALTLQSVGPVSKSRATLIKKQFDCNQRANLTIPLLFQFIAYVGSAIILMQQANYGRR